MLKSALTFLVPSGNFQGDFFIYLYTFLGISLFKGKKRNVKNVPTTRVQRAGSRHCKNNSKLRREFNLIRFGNLSYFHTQTNKRRRDKANSRRRARRPVRPRVRRFKLSSPSFLQKPLREHSGASSPFIKNKKNENKKAKQEKSAIVSAG